jgi:uncharacterized protein (TIGR03435 family)
MKHTALMILAGTLVIATVTSARQSRLTFEVASIKPSSSGRPGISIQTSPGRFKAINATVRFLFVYAYGIKDFQLMGGPDWVSSDAYDIEATSGPKGNERDFPLMTRALLENRFQLKFHRDTKELPVYEMVVAKSGLKLLPSADGEAPATRGRRGDLVIKAGTMANLASSLSTILGRKVVDKTKLNKKYDMSLKWTPDEFQAPPLRPDAPPADPNAPSIFTAIQEQLGLALESSTGPVEVFIIDSVQRPTEN